MIHAYDQWLLMPVRDLYDTQMMLASIGAAKDMYERAEKRIDDFRKEYSDFVTPFAKDLAEYNRMMSNVYSVINDAYARGEDPLRSAEGQLTIQRAINQMDPAKVAIMKTNAKYGVPYGQSRDELIAKGLYNKDYEDYVLGQMGMPSYDDFSSFDDKGNSRLWTMSAAPQYDSMREYTEPLYKNVKPHDATLADVESFGMQYNPNYKYTDVITRQDLIDATKGNMLGMLDTVRYGYERQRVAQALLQQLDEAPTEEQIDNALIDHFVNSNLDILKKPDYDWDKMTLKRMTAGLSGSRSGGGKLPEYIPSIFDEAHLKYISAVESNNGNKNVRGYNTSWDITTNPQNQWINPIDASIGIDITKNKKYVFTMPISTASEMLFDYKSEEPAKIDNSSPSMNLLMNALLTTGNLVIFKPNGQLFEDGNGCWIVGTAQILYNDSEGKKHNMMLNGGKQTIMPVTRQYYNYNNLLSKEYGPTINE